jgi:hypothetical protein
VPSLTGSPGLFALPGLTVPGYLGGSPSPPPPGPYTSTTYGSPFTYKFYDLVTWDYLGALPLTQVSYSKMLNDAGPFQGTLNLSDPRVQAINPMAICRPGRTAVFVDYQGFLDYGGVVWTRQYDPSHQTVSIGGSELWSYPEERVQAKDYSLTWFAPANPMIIAKTVITDALNKSYSGLSNMIVKINGSVPYHSYVSMSFPYVQMQTVGSIVQMMQQMGYGIGFDFAVDCVYSAGVPQPILNLSFPQRGRTGNNSPLVINTERCITYQYPEDATQAGNTIYETSTSAGSQLIIEVCNAALQNGYPLLEQLIQHPDINSVALSNLNTVLKGAAVGDLSIFAYPVITPTATVYANDGSVGIGDYNVGDNVRFIIPAQASGKTYDPRFPNGIDTTLRITESDVTVADEGISTILHTLNMPTTAQAIAPPI